MTTHGLSDIFIEVFFLVLGMIKLTQPVCFFCNTVKKFNRSTKKAPADYRVECFCQQQKALCWGLCSFHKVDQSQCADVLSVFILSRC